MNGRLAASSPGTLRRRIVPKTLAIAASSAVTAFAVLLSACSPTPPPPSRVSTASPATETPTPTPTPTAAAQESAMGTPRMELLPPLAAATAQPTPAAPDASQASQSPPPSPTPPSPQLSPPPQPSPTPQPTTALRGSTAVPVFYATSRGAAPNARVTDPARYFGTQKRDPAHGLAYGWVYVSIPSAHVSGETERPSLLRLEVKRDPGKHALWGHLHLLESEKALQAELSGRAKFDGGRVLLYVHGYDDSFAGTILRAAQLSVDARFKGLTFAFSWPSLSKRQSAIADRDAVSLANTELKKLIRVLLATSGVEAVDIVAHSTGAEIAMLAIEGLHEDPAVVARRGLGQAVLVSADVPAARFEQIRSSAARNVEGLTVYFGQNDWALLASTYLSEPRFARAGERGADIVDIPNLERRLFDTHPAEYAERRPVLCDLFQVLRYRRPASERTHLVRLMNARGVAYYQLRDVPVNCPP